MKIYDAVEVPKSLASCSTIAAGQPSPGFLQLVADPSERSLADSAADSNKLENGCRVIY